MTTPGLSRRRTVVVVALMALACLTLRADGMVQQTVLDETFSGATTSAPVYGLDAGFVPCLTAIASPGDGNSSVPNCGLAQPDPVGQGTLRFTANLEQQASAIVFNNHLPTIQGLKVTFAQYQYGGYGLGGPGNPGGADGIAFFLAVAPPLPATMGPQGGALGYAADSGTAGLPNGWLGIGLDSFGLYSSPSFGGAGCVQPAWAGYQPDAITVRGPEYSGYCLLSSSAENGGLPGGVSLRGADRAGSKRTIQVLIDPIAGTYTVSIDPAGGTDFQVATSGPLPASYRDPGTLQITAGIPNRLTFGFTASTGSATDFHEISDVTVTTINGEVPVLGLAMTNGLAQPPVSGESFEFTLTPQVDGTVPVAFPLNVSGFLSPGMSLADTPYGTNWSCIEEQSDAYSCNYSPIPPYPVGTVFPAVHVPVVLDNNLSPGQVMVHHASVFSLDSVEAQASNTVVAASGLTVTTTQLPDGTIGSPYNAVLAAIAGSPAYTWTLAGGALPPGLSLSAAGAITGTPTTAGLFAMTVGVTDSLAASASQALSINVTPPPVTITSSSLPDGVVGMSYSSAPVASGGTGAFTWTLEGGTLPAGLALAANGAITGTPTAAGLATFTVRATDSVAAFATKALSITVSAAPIVITTVALPGGTVSTAYSASVAATGGTGTFTWTVQSGTLPAGLALAANGAITGTPTAAGLATFTVRATDSVAAFATKALSITVAAAPIVITTITLPGGTVGTAYSASVAATGGTGTFTWTVQSGTLPAGLALAANGAITGTPTAAGLATFTVRATDSVAAFATKALSITVAAAPIVITTVALPGGTVGTAYSASVAATGGTGTFTWTVQSGTLPAGLALAGNGAITGTPTAAGLATFTVRATDSVAAFATKALSITVSAAPIVITTITLPGGTVGTAYSASVAATGGTGTFTWTVQSGTLPAGLALAGNGAITGTPTAAGLATFTVRATDSVAAFATKALSITVSAAPIVITTVALPGGTVGTAYSASVAATGGTGTMTWTLQSGTLPAGLALAANGAITGTPTAAGLATFTVRATDRVAAFATKALSITVAAGLSPLTMNTTVVPNGRVGTPYNFTLAASGGTLPYTWRISGGQLPAGLSLTAAGVIAGTPTTVQTVAYFTARVTDGGGRSVQRNFTIAVSALAITTTSLSNANIGTMYFGSLATTGSVPGVTWTVLSGALPPGLSLSIGGIQGTPTAPGSFTFTLCATDASGATATRTFTLTVTAIGSVFFEGPFLHVGTMGVPVQFQLSAFAFPNVPTTFTWSIQSGSLPPGVSLSPSGVISGTPTITGPYFGSYTATVRITSSYGWVGQGTLFFVTINPNFGG